ncbi:uncharacterized protein LOC118372816 isoform X6 [Oncorhynchus keta]|uniref:uncharacterized protein LOC118372816 isoform X6 n=1 Tax=Oncorhynchus keta TaxID=8018 RepID=UPI00227B4848|nr:uncharacterized protein LOC118372816 isoform X6 [Oncorhynchus keta]
MASEVKPVFEENTALGFLYRLMNGAFQDRDSKDSVFSKANLKLGFICEEHTSPVCQWPSKVSICPVKPVTTPNCSQVKNLDCKDNFSITPPHHAKDKPPLLTLRKVSVILEDCRNLLGDRFRQCEREENGFEASIPLDGLGQCAV